MVKVAEKRLNISLSDEEYNAMREMAQEANMDMSTFMRQSLKAYSYLRSSRKAGERIFVGKETAERELVLL